MLTNKNANLSRRRKIAYLITPAILVAGFGVAATTQAAHAATWLGVTSPAGRPRT